MINNLNKDRTFVAQVNRTTNFLNNNWKDLPDVGTEVGMKGSIIKTLRILQLFRF